jgi:5-methyltetrahydropteroyltriglutamate--homocysteine methyltransferase
MFETTVAGSLPKPLWLAEPEKLWPAWKLEGDALAAGKIDATILAVKRQEDAGIDIVSDGEQARIHFVHGFLAHLDGIDFSRRQTIGIRADRYKAEVPTVTGPIRRKGSVHRAEASAARAHTRRKLKFTLPGPMTIVDTIADEHYRDRPTLAHAFAAALNEEAHELAALGVDVVQFDEPAFNVYMREVKDWGVAALERAAEGLKCTTAVHICYGYGIKANADLRGDIPGVGQEPDRTGVARMPQFARADRADWAPQGQGCSGRLHRRCVEHRREAGRGRRHHPRRAPLRPGRTAFPVHQLRHGPDGRANRLRQARGAGGGSRAGPQGVMRRA